MKKGKDPKQIITPYAFEVNPSLLGRLLATPRRRLAAVLVDLAVASLLANLGGVVLGSVVAAFFFIAAVRHRKGHILRRWTRIGFAATGAFIIFILSLVLIEKNHLPEEADPEVAADVSDIDWTAYTQRAMSIDYSDSAGVEASVESLAEDLEQDILSKFGDQVQPPALPENAAKLLMAYAHAYQQQDSTGMDTLHNAAQNIVAGEVITDLRNTNAGSMAVIEQLEDENDKLREVAENPGFLRTLRAVAEDMGLAVGWIGIYFTVFLACWKGQTPGKWLLRLKVVRLNGKPLNIWHSFGRFGGYAAGFATGLLGFVQIYWDANRQAIHDKISGTVVLDVRG